MLAELAAANAAFGVIKQAIANSRELADVGKSIASFVSAEEDLKAKAEAKKKSPWNKLMGKDATDFEEFLALEKINQQKAQLQSHMRLYGRPGMYDAWVEYQAKARTARKEAQKQREKERQEFLEILMWLFIVIVVWGGAGGGLYYYFVGF
jgi:pyruvate/2-oxoglutarate dehydrogenase complex dihydrolipoamide acyltransferase (E2) component